MSDNYNIEDKSPEELRVDAAAGKLTNKIMHLIEHHGDPTVRFIIAAGASVNSELDNGYSILQAAIHAQQLELAEWLIANGADVEKQQLALFAHAINIEFSTRALKLLLKSGCEINCIGQGTIAKTLRVGSTSEHMMVTPLMLAIIKSGQTAREVKFLLENKADINLAVNGVYPIHLAIAKGKNAAFQLLVDHGSDLSKKNENGLTVQEHVAAIADQMDPRGISRRNDSIVFQAIIANKLSAVTVPNL